MEELSLGLPKGVQGLLSGRFIDVTLVDRMQAPAYPNPQALFILNEI